MQRHREYLPALLNFVLIKVLIALIVLAIALPARAESASVKSAAGEGASESAAIGAIKLIPMVAKFAPVPAETVTQVVSQPPEPDSGAGSLASQAGDRGEWRDSRYSRDSGASSISNLDRLISAGRGGNVTERLELLEQLILGSIFVTRSDDERLCRLEQVLCGRRYGGSAAARLARLQQVIVPRDAADSQGLEETRPGFSKKKMVPRHLIACESARKMLVAMINEVRRSAGRAPLSHSVVAYKLAMSQLRYITQIGRFTHYDALGQNPDRRYTVAGGTGVMTESLAIVGIDSREDTGIASDEPAVESLAKRDAQSREAESEAAAAVAGVASEEELRSMFVSMMQERRNSDALLSNDATAIAVAVRRFPQMGVLGGCCEVLSESGKIDALDPTVSIGDTIDVSGQLPTGYKLKRVAVAFDPKLEPLAYRKLDETPYSPPLDYGVFLSKGAKHKLAVALAAVGIGGALAGSLFCPPGILAVPPLIDLVSGDGARTQDQPIESPVIGKATCKNGLFHCSVPLDHSTSAGIYYLTIWASPERGSPAVVVSRRAIAAEPQGAAGTRLAGLQR